MKNSKLSLPAIFSNNMMLQEGKENLFWGKSAPGSRITVLLANKKAEGKADNKGFFKIMLPALSSGGPYTMIVKASGETVTVKNILAGDVWLCSGQSNMAWIVKDSKNALKEIKEAKYPKMRLFSVPAIHSFTPFTDVKGKWEEVAPGSVGKFSAAGYFFGRELHKQLHKPIGLINSSYGGSALEWWMSAEALKSWKGFLALKKRTALLKKKANFEKKAKPMVYHDLHTDTENKGLELGYEKENYDFRKWKTLKAPGYWNAQGLNFVGAVWLKKEVKIPEAWRQYDLALELGSIVDCDTSYFNGVRVGSTGSDVPNFWEHRRRYLIPAQLVKKENNITVRVFAANRVGGFGSAKGMMNIGVINHAELGKIKIENRWSYQVERKLPSLGMGEGTQGIDEKTHGTLYNSMLSPLVGFGLKGFIWYQGESNALRAKEYAALSKMFLADLRNKWQDSSLPFYFVQLANFASGSGDWPALRKAQTDLLEIPNTGMAMALDIGESLDIHPKNKQEVGRRLALPALAGTYGKKLVYSGPIFKALEIKGRKVRVHFKHAESGLKAAERGTLAGFEIAGKSGFFVNAKARIDKKTVLVWNDNVREPKAVRYSWASDPKCSLYNKAGLPAAPFKTGF